MKKEIRIDISDRNELLDKFNDNKISREVIEYIIKEAIVIGRNTEIELVVNKDKSIILENCRELIKNGLKDEYKRSLEIQHDNNVKQIYFLQLGIVLLFFSTLVKNEGICREILLISGWVPIWEMVKIELFPDVEGKIKRRYIKKLLRCEIIENI